MDSIAAVCKRVNDLLHRFTVCFPHQLGRSRALELLRRNTWSLWGILYRGQLQGPDCKCQAHRAPHLLSQQDSYGQRGRGSHGNHQTEWDRSCRPGTHTCRHKQGKTNLRSQILPQAAIREVKQSVSEEI